MKSSTGKGNPSYVKPETDRVKSDWRDVCSNSNDSVCTGSGADSRSLRCVMPKTSKRKLKRRSVCGGIDEPEVRWSSTGSKDSSHGIPDIKREGPRYTRLLGDRFNPRCMKSDTDSSKPGHANP